MNIIKKYDYKPLQRIDSPNGRKYIVGESRPLPSITTILSKTKDMTFLKEWRKNVGEEAATKIVTEAAGIGTDMHNNLENYILDKPMAGTVLSQCLANVIIKQGLVNVDEVWGTEVALYASGLYAGTTDILGTHKGVPAIIDFKNSRKEKKKEWVEDYQAQLAGYALAHNEMYGTNIHKGVIMMVTRDAKYQEFIFSGIEFDRCIDLWLARLTQYYDTYGNI